MMMKVKLVLVLSLILGVTTAALLPHSHTPVHLSPPASPPSPPVVAPKQLPFKTVSGRHPCHVKALEEELVVKLRLRLKKKIMILKSSDSIGCVARIWLSLWSWWL